MNEDNNPDHLAFRKALSVFPTGVTIATCFDPQGHKTGITISSFNSVSLDPPLILWSIDRQAPEFGIFSQTQYFCINVLSENQAPISVQFANPHHDKFHNIDTITGLENILCLKDCAARFECKIWNRYDGGDHIIIVGEVLRFQTSNEQPLVFVNGRYAKISADKVPT